MAINPMLPKQRVHVVKLMVMESWYEIAKEKLSDDDAKRWAIRNWVERSLTRNGAEDYPTIRYRVWRQFNPSHYDTIIQSKQLDCTDKCKFCIRWMCNIYNDQEWYYTQKLLKVLAPRLVEIALKRREYVADTEYSTVHFVNQRILELAS